MNTNKILCRIVLFLATISAALLLTFFIRQTLNNRLNALELSTNKPQEAWMTVFVHGSFATTLGLISVFNVIKDKVQNTNYKKMTRLMRNDPFFYQMQPLQELGLKPLEPHFEPKSITQKYAVFPIAAAYEMLSAHANHAQEKNYFYTFGWSGLISQQRRRKEAVRLYNALIVEYQSLLQRGIKPKIRLIAHSHGGNVILNTGGIHELLQKGLDDEPNAARYPDADQQASMHHLYELLTKTKKKLALDHIPVAPFCIDEVILMGTPIQPETLPFCLSPFFKKIYNFYSDDDIIQSMDWVSTRRYYSEKRIAFSPIAEERPTIVQIKITLNKPQSDEEKKATNTPPQENTENQRSLGVLKDTMNALWTRLFSNQTKKPALDPLHKEFWFMGWKASDQNNLAQQHIQPYPYVILLPYIQRLLTKVPHLLDLDITLKFGEQTVSMTAYAHDTTEKEAKIYVDRSLLHQLQEYAQAWKPDNITPSYEMELLHRYSQMLKA